MRRRVLRLLILLFAVLLTALPAPALAALDFDGTDDQVNHGDIAAVDGASVLTVMGWFWIDTEAEAHNFLVAKDGAFRLGWFGTFHGAGNILVATTSAIKGQVNGALTLGVWAHWALVFDGAQADNATRLKLYKDGVLQTLSFTGTVGVTLPDAGAEPVRVFSNTSNAMFTDGRAAVVKLWNAALSPNEIAQELHCLRPNRFDGLLVWAPYDDGRSAIDYSDRSNHGTVTGTFQSPGPPVSCGGE